MTNFTEIPLKGILKTIEGDLQNALYYNSQGIFAKDNTETLFYLRKVEAILEKIRETIGSINSNSDSIETP
jgi:hypothetical protein